MLDDLLVIDGFKVVQGKRDLRQRPPGVKYKDRKGEDKYKNICRYTVPEFKDKVERVILAAYRMSAAQK